MTIVTETKAVKNLGKKKAPAKPRVKKLSKELEAVNDAFNEVKLGVVAEKKEYIFSFTSPLMAVGYNVRDLENFHRTLLAHHVKKSITVWGADLAREFSDISVRKTIFNDIRTNKEEILDLLEFIAKDKSGPGEKVLFVTDFLKLIEEYPAAAKVLVEIIKLAASKSNFHLILSTHGNRISNANEDTLKEITDLIPNVFFAGNIFEKEFKRILGRSSTSAEYLEKHEDGLYTNRKLEQRFTIYVTPPRWFEPKEDQATDTIK